ncbi:MAG: phage major capsid protein [Candidatus Pacearchaeota archaeon]|jgi:HK97 family phage major capsid protein
MPNEIQEKMDTALGLIADIQEVNNRNAKNFSDYNEQMKKMNEDVTKNLDEVNTLKSVQQKNIEQLEKIEKALCNLNNSSGQQNKILEVKTRDEFTNYLRKGTMLSEDSVLYIVDDIIKKGFIGLSEDKKQMFRKDLQDQVDPDGGYWVRPEISNVMIKRIFETSPVRQVASTINIRSDAVEYIVDDNEGDGGWVGETDSRPSTTTPQIGKLTIYAHELYAQPKVTQKMLDDAGFDIEAWLQGKIVRKFTRLENNAFVVGNGNKKPKGFLSYPAWTTPGTYERGKLEQLTSSTSLTYTADDIKALQNALIEDYQPNAVWAMNRTTFGLITRLKEAVTGQYLLDPNSFKVGDTKILLGSNVVFMHDIPTIVANSLSIVYGDFSIGYTIVDRIGVRIVRDIYLAKPYILYYTTKRVGGDVTNYDSLKIGKVKP